MSSSTGRGEPWAIAGLQLEQVSSGAKARYTGLQKAKEEKQHTLRTWAVLGWGAILEAPNLRRGIWTERGQGCLQCLSLSPQVARENRKSPGVYISRMQLLHLSREAAGTLPRSQREPR